ncbi:MAG: glycosyltransferase family 4 protein [Nitrospiraceae bacterium]
MVRIFRREKPVLVHTHTSKAGVLGRIAAWIARVPAVVHTPHGHVFYGHFGSATTKLFLHIERWLSRFTHRMVALTEAERADHLDRAVGEAGKFAVVPSGIDLDRFRQVAVGDKAAPETFACPPDAFVVGSVGWLTGIKGHRFLIEAVAELAADHPDLHLVIVGSGDLKGALEQLATSLGLRKRVHLIGRREDVDLCLAGMDLFVLPSLNEGMGRALIEAMAAGLPAIATRVGGVPALIEDGRTGLLVPPADSHALAAAIRTLVEDPARRRAMGAAGQASVTERFSDGAMVRSLERLYRDLLTEVGAW